MDFSNLNMFDYIGLGIIGLFLLIGFKKGFLKELAKVLSLVLSVVGAKILGSTVETYLYDLLKIKDKLLESVSLSFVENTQYSVDYCAVFRKDSAALQKQFNSAITQLKTDGVFDKINKSYRAGESYSSDNVTLNDGKITVLCCPVFDSLLCFDESGNVKGKELDFISEMCNALSLEAELMIITEYDEMFTALNEGEGDVIISAVEHTAELEADYLLSDVYNQTTFGVYKRK